MFYWESVIDSRRPLLKLVKLFELLIDISKLSHLLITKQKNSLKTLCSRWKHGLLIDDFWGTNNGFEELINDTDNVKINFCLYCIKYSVYKTIIYVEEALNLMFRKEVVLKHLFLLHLLPQSTILDQF